MEVTSLLVAVISALISIGSAFAAWRAVRPRPKLKGEITFAWTSEFGSTVPGVPAGRVVGVHVVLTNASSHPVHPLSYKVSVRRNDHKWIDGRRLQNWQTSPVTLNVGANEIRLDQDKLVDWPPRPVHHGAPMMGFLAHLIPGLSAQSEIDMYRVSVVDVFGKEIYFEKVAAIAHAYAENPDSFTVVEAFKQAGADVTSS